MTKAAGRGARTPQPAYHNLNELDIKAMIIDYLTTPMHVSGPLFIVVFFAFLRIIGGIRTAAEARQARRNRRDTELAEMRADIAEVKATAQATLATLADLRTHFDEVAGKMDKTADRLDAAVTRLNAPVLRIVPAAE
jgi:septal ring factor EnvC (AmiA/AmiB activator)